MHIEIVKQKRLSAVSLLAIPPAQILRMAFNVAVVAVIALSALPAAFAADRLPVFVSILPQKYFVEKIGGEFVDVKVMVQPGASPAGYEPKPGQMVDLVNARIYFAIGVPFEATWLGKISGVNSNMTVVHTESGIARLPMAGVHLHDEKVGDAESREHSGASSSGTDEDSHGQDGYDPHIWLSPPLVKVQAQAILAALAGNDPAHGDIFEENCRRFISEIDDLDTGFRAMFGGGSAVRFMVFHPSWGYFADAYGLEQIPIEIEGKDPKPAQLRALIEYARREGIRVIFVQPQFSSKSAELIAREIDGRIAFADPLAEDWGGNLKTVADAFKAGMR